MLKAYLLDLFRKKEFLKKLFVFIFTFITSLSVTTVQIHAESLFSELSEQKNKDLLSPIVEPIKQELGAIAYSREEVEEEPECKLSDSFTDQVKHWEEDVCRWGEEHDMDPDLIATVMQIESCGNPNAVSATGVRGLFQVTGANLDGQNPFDPNVSMAKGPGKVLKTELKLAHGDVKAAMAGYNGGGKARDYIGGKITRSQFYTYLVNHRSGLWRTRSRALAKVNEVERYAQWADIYFEAKDNRKDTLQIWWDLGGHRLCSSAEIALSS